MVTENKANFTDVEIINLPFSPFSVEAGTELEIKLLNYISNSIVNIEKKMRRTHKQGKASKDFNFYKSSVLIGIDISAYVAREISYLDNLIHVTNLHPFILINNSIEYAELIKLRLHKELFDRGFILPVLPLMTPVDHLYTFERYGADIEDLLAGNLPQISLKSLSNLGITYDLNDLVNRFRCLSLKEDKLSYFLNISWLGVDNSKISDLLNWLFNFNVAEFSLTDICKKFDVDKEEFVKYALHSMLFSFQSDDKVAFRFIRKNMLLKIKAGLAQEFEDNLYKYSAIDTSYTNYQKFKGTFVEYHYLGKIFNCDNQTYSLKLISNLKKSISEIDFKRIVLIENGHEKDLRIHLQCCFQKPISRILNNLGEPQFYPFDQFSYYEDVLIITDITNTGKFLSSTIEFLQSEVKAKIKGIYSFVIDTDLNIEKYKKEIDGDYSFSYYIEKKLGSVGEISKEIQSRNRNENQDQRFLFFWEGINRFGFVEKEVAHEQIRNAELLENLNEISSIWFQHLNFNEEAHNIIKATDDFALYLQSFLLRNHISGCLINKSKSAKSFANILTRINSSIEIQEIEFDKPSNTVLDFIRQKSHVLLYNNAFNIGISLTRFLKYIEVQDSNLLSKITFLALFSRKNSIQHNDHLVEKLTSNLSHVLSNNISVYYKSDIPFYCLNVGDIERDKYIERKLTGAER